MNEKYYDPDRPLKYKYTSENKSILDNYVLNHWWPIAIKAVPPSASANLVSILGSLSCWLGFLVLSGAVFGPMELVARRKPWIFGLAAFLVFLYQTLDSLDGIQARRTGASGPLGEFVDHWFDSINAFLIPLGIALAFPVVPPAFAALTLLFGASASWLSARAIRDSGVMKFGPVSGEEVLSFTYLFFLAVWITGYDFWVRPAVLGMAPIALVYTIVPFLLAGSSIASAASVSVSGFKHYAAAMAAVLPTLVWTLLALRGHHRAALAVGGLLICFSASRYAGDVLRDRLTGLEYRPVQLDIVALDLLLLASILMPGLPPRTTMFVACAALSWLGLSLFVQFSRTAARIREVTGVPLFQVAPHGEGAVAKRPAFAIPPIQFRRRWR